MLKRTRERIEVEGLETVVSSKPKHVGKHIIPAIELTFVTEDREVIVITLPAAVAAKMTDEMITSLRTALPKIPRRGPHYT
ncbi:hypothetical protein ACFZA2_10305 [Microbacterium sp. NPDC007973]|uniref:hypothetical protein n=1 Tax=Microbacterium sp. NPDC007973 TaxID=3364182 RepID=UPI0036EAE45F